MVRKGASVQDQAERDLRLTKVAPLLLSGKTQWDIAGELGVDQSTISRDIKTLRQRWQKSAQNDMHRYISEIVAVYKLIIGAHLPLALQGKTRSAEVVMAAQEKLATLMGLNQPTRQEIEQKTTTMVQIIADGDD